ncbi:MAG: hypothetical protein ABI323_05020 [Solirubrobacteraceae bacterium]
MLPEVASLSKLRLLIGFGQSCGRQISGLEQRTHHETVAGLSGIDQRLDQLGVAGIDRGNRQSQPI